MLVKVLAGCDFRKTLFNRNFTGGLKAGRHAQMIIVLDSTEVHVVDSRVPAVWSRLFADNFKVVNRATEVPMMLTLSLA